MLEEAGMVVIMLVLAKVGKVLEVVLALFGQMIQLLLYQLAIM